MRPTPTRDAGTTMRTESEDGNAPDGGALTGTATTAGAVSKNDSGSAGRRSRDPYPEVCQRARLATQRARKAKINGRDWRVLSVVLDETAAQSRFTNRIPQSSFTEATGMDLRDVQRSRTQLVTAKAITYTPSRGRLASLYGLPLAEPTAVGPSVGEPTAVGPSVENPTNGFLHSQPTAPAPPFREGPSKAASSRASAEGGESERFAEADAPALDDAFDASASSKPSGQGSEPQAFAALLADVSLEGKGRSDVLRAWSEDADAPRDLAAKLAELRARPGVNNLGGLLVACVREEGWRGSKPKPKRPVSPERWVTVTGYLFEPAELAERLGRDFGVAGREKQRLMELAQNVRDSKPEEVAA